MNYESSGTVRVKGCAATDYAENFVLLFPVGSRAFVKNKATKGKIESIVIKKFRRLLPQNIIVQGIQPEIMYEDTLNRVWAEGELIEQSIAIDLYNSFIEETNRLRELMEECVPIRSTTCF